MQETRNQSMTELYEEKTIKIRKPHQCCVCLRKIPKGFKCIHHRVKQKMDFSHTILVIHVT